MLELNIFHLVSKIFFQMLHFISNAFMFYWLSAGFQVILDSFFICMSWTCANYHKVFVSDKGI
jgi:hypothetical protein